MKNITEIDNNFKIKSEFNEPDICFYNVSENRFCLYGLICDNGFRRMPEDIAKTINEGVFSLHTNTSGGRVRFVTDSPYVAIAAKMPDRVDFPHMAQTGVSGFDMYADGVFSHAYIPPENYTGGFNAIKHFTEEKKREITINFPLYNNVDELFIGLKAGAGFAPTESSYDKKLVFYGSSITQGGCVSRPGNAYPALMSRMLNCDFVNLGFSGSARGEIAMAQYIASVDADAYVIDYDHNAPDLEFLENTHESFFKAFRELKPTVPVILVSAPNITSAEGIWGKRRKVIKNTYIKATERGDSNVYFIDGEVLWEGDFRDSCSVDCCHPNDLGHFRMAKKMADFIKALRIL